MNLTKEQELAVFTEGSNIIVSAGAGSGKTAVLTERVIRKLKDGIDIDKLLILTFTNEAANEMKSRIREAIIKNGLDNQLLLLDSAYITTFDSFAFSIVKKYHYILNISNNPKIIDSNIITIKKNQILDKLFEDSYKTRDFDDLITTFCLKDDKNIKEFIIQITESLSLLIDKETYLKEYLVKFYSKSFIKEIISKYYHIIDEKIAEIKDIYYEYDAYLNDTQSIKVKEWLKPLFDGTKYEDYLLINSISTPRITKLNEEAVSIKDTLKNKLDELKVLLRFKDENEIITRINSTLGFAKTILNLVTELDKSIDEFKNEYEIYEFNDISHMAINIVKNNIDIRNELKEYFNEIMIDEYQDTSNIQEVFINYISNNNVYMVGDIKQSIYRFRNANPYIFKEKYDNYSKSTTDKKIDLLKNFRSRHETIGNINEIFNLIMDDEIGNAKYSQEHNMVYGNTDYDIEDNHENNKMEIYTYNINPKYTKEEHELFIISEDIQNKIKNHYQVFDKKTKKLRDLKYSDICIITDRNKYLPLYKKILEYHHIPSVIYMEEILTNDSLFLVLKNLINMIYIVKEEENIPLLKYLFTSVSRSFIFEYEDDTIYKLLNNNEFLNDEIIKKCHNIDLNNPLATIICDIIDEFNIYEKLTNMSDIEKNIISISNLIDIANSLSEIGYSLTDFIEYLDNTINLGLNVKYNVNTFNDSAVKIMNIHKSKGLEFNICYYTGLYNRFTIKEISNKFIFSEKYGMIIPYISDNDIKFNILKDLYVYDYLKEEISEKIRLFYVSLTRCREKMIILKPETSNIEKYNKLVPNIKRMAYRSFLDIVDSLNIIDKYTILKEAKYTKDYNKLPNITFEEIKNETKINLKEVNIDYHKIENKHFSKENISILNKETINAMEYGTKIHESLEYTDFYNPNNIYVKNLLKKVPNDFINVYKEYAFTYYEEDTKYDGVVDLILEYKEFIYIIDYKLKNIDEEAYKKQLKGYKKYISNITGKKVYTYLYSIIDDNLKEVNNEK